MDTFVNQYHSDFGDIVSYCKSYDIRYRIENILELLF